eukprot:1138021-Pelagomonas_calceolata.AAC.4
MRSHISLPATSKNLSSYAEWSLTSKLARFPSKAITQIVSSNDCSKKREERLVCRGNSPYINLEREGESLYTNVKRRRIGSEEP